MTSFLRRAIFRILIFSLCVSVASSAQNKQKPSVAPRTPTRVLVDATHAPEKILHSQLQIPVSPGELKLVYPKWIPGEHGPTGPIVDLTGVQFLANGQRLAWRRDLVEMYMFHLTIPQGVKTLEARLDLVLPAPPEGFSSGASATAQLDVVSWNQLVLYEPANSDNIYFTASLKLPDGWHYGTALPVENESSGQINFQTVSLTTLVDSPVLASRHFRRIPLTPDGPIQHFIDMGSDSDAALEMPPEIIEEYKRLIAE